MNQIIDSGLYKRGLIENHIGLELLGNIQEMGYGASDTVDHSDGIRISP
jgi:hypothetical protein